MIKFILFVSGIFVLALVSPIGKTIQESVTQNYTYTAFNANLTTIGWFDAYMRAWWWVVPLAILVIFIIMFMKKDEPESPFASMIQQQPRIPRQRKQKIVQQNPKPPIFFGK
jgi:hypothetical protein